MTHDKQEKADKEHSVVEFGGLPPLILFFNMSIGWFGRFANVTEQGSLVTRI